MWVYKPEERKLKKFFKLLGEYLVKTSHVIFQVSAVTFLIFVALENLKTGLISNYFDINFLSSLVVVSGLLTLLFYDEKQPWYKISFTLKKPYFLMALTFLAVSFFTWKVFLDWNLVGLLFSLFFGLLSIIIISLFYRNSI